MATTSAHQVKATPGGTWKVTLTYASRRALTTCTACAMPALRNTSAVFCRSVSASTTEREPPWRFVDAIRVAVLPRKLGFRLDRGYPDVTPRA